MGLIQRLIQRVSENKTEFKEKLKQAEIELKIAKTLEERNKSSNRRELERYYKENEEAEIKKKLDQIHHQETRDNWSGKNSIMKQKMNILKEDRPILKERNIFKGNQNKYGWKQKGMYFK
jgi:hypothetical protein